MVREVPSQRLLPDQTGGLLMPAGSSVDNIVKRESRPTTEKLQSVTSLEPRSVTVPRHLASMSVILL